jgi:SAM-dependent methyltransferase
MKMALAYNHNDMAFKTLKGEGIEIGGLHHPLLLDWNVASVRYVDRIGVDEARRHYPELDNYDLVSPDIISDSVPAVPFDFCIAMDVVEHLPDPISFFLDVAAYLTVGGHLFIRVPNADHSFDKGRELTTWEHLVRDHQDGGLASKPHHYWEWVRDVEDREAASKKMERLMSINYAIHFHVWNSQTFPIFIQSVIADFNLPLLSVWSEYIEGGSYVLLQKTKDYI